METAPVLKMVVLSALGLLLQRQANALLPQQLVEAPVREIVTVQVQQPETDVRVVYQEDVQFHLTMLHVSVTAWMLQLSVQVKQ